MHRLALKPLVLLLLLAGAGFAQKLIEPSQLPATVMNFDPSQPHESLPCTVKQIEPVLGFGSGFLTGYTLRAAREPGDAARRWYIVLRVHAEDGGKPIYFMDSVNLSAVSQPDFVASVRGLFLVGEGRYFVTFSLLDDLGRVCRHAWTVEARLGKNDRNTRTMLAPGTVTDLSFSPAPSAVNASLPHLHRLTVLLNILPAAPRFVKPGQPDGVEWLLTQWGMLLSMLASLQEQIPADSVRIVGFSVGQERETFRQDDFTLHDVNHIIHLGDVLESEPGIDSFVRNPAGVWSLLAGLVDREIRAEPPSDAVIFLGVPMGSVKTPSLPFQRSAPTPHFFYLQYRPNRLRLPVDPWNTPILPQSRADPYGNDPHLPPEPLDCIGDWIRRVHGKLLTIYTPVDFNQAVKKIDRSDR